MLWNRNGRVLVHLLVDGVVAFGDSPKWMETGEWFWMATWLNGSDATRRRRLNACCATTLLC